MVDSLFQEQELSMELEVDSAPDDDSALGAHDGHSITTSLDSAVCAFRHENGRRYHSFSETAYFLPNDQPEADRLNLQHYTWRLTFSGALGLVPIVPATMASKRILDVGTGTGAWAIDVAEAHPDVHVIGTDLSPIQPDYVPLNCEFVIDHAEQDWAWDKDFSYIHARMLLMGLHDWPRFFRQSFAFLEPGGWLELAEPCLIPQCADPNVTPAVSAFMRWGEFCHQAMAQVDVNAGAPLLFEEQLRAQGFVNVKRVDVQWPIRAWAKGKKNKLLGKLVYENSRNAVEAIALFLFIKQLGWTKAEVDKYIEEVLADMDRHPFFFLMMLFTAQKPRA